VEKPYLTVEQCAERLQVSSETIRSYINTKKNPLPAIRLGREYRINPDDFQKWLNQRKNAQPET